jgi:lysophospholipase L1-like esterase
MSGSKLRAVLWTGVTFIVFFPLNTMYGQNAPAAPAPALAKSTLAAVPPRCIVNAHDQELLTDFANLKRFKADDDALTPTLPGQDRVVFMGDSITEGWKFDGPDGSFQRKPYLNRGISGQTTPQMLLRFRQDVIDLKPALVVILAGTNDIAGNTGPMTPEQTEENLKSMADLATANGIRVVLSSILPAFDYPWSPGLAPAPKIAEINSWMSAYAAEKGYVYVDYWSAMKDDRGGLPATLSKDGVHPEPAGYAVMTPLAEAGIQKAMQSAPQH